MGPNISKEKGQKTMPAQFEPNMSTLGPATYNESSGFMPGSHDGSMVNSFIRGFPND